MFVFEKYSEERENCWDDFLFQKSINGTFLQSRRFLNYHPKNRFEDCSIIVFDNKKNIAAIIPACVVKQDGKKVFFSHKGSTFGGIVISARYYRVKYLLPLLEELKQYWKEEGFDEVYLKITSDLFSSERTDLLQYALYYSGFVEYKELSTYVDFTHCREELLLEFSSGKRGHIRKCIKEGMVLRNITSREEIGQFYNILCINLEKYHTKPIHSEEELIELKEKRLVSEIGFFGCYKGDEMIAGSMMFYFDKTKTAHAQYLCANPVYNSMSPATFLYYSMMEEMRKIGYKRISWGIATEDFGRSINIGLINSKEDCGSEYCNNLIYSLGIL